MNKIYSILLLIGLIIISGCSDDFFETTLTIDPPPHEEKLTLSAYLDSNNDFPKNGFISLGRSIGLLDNRDINNNHVDSATATMTINDATVINMTNLYNNLFDNYVLESTYDFRIGDKIELAISHPDFESISSVQVIPDSVPITSVEIVEDYILGGEGENFNAVKVQFSDPAGIKNFYEAELFVSPGAGSYFPLSIYSDDPNVWMGVDPYQSVVLDDGTFDGQNHTFYIIVEEDYSGNLDDLDFRLTWRSLSEDMYLFSRSVVSQQQSEEFGFFAEPVSIHSNVENGLGLFGARTTTYFHF